MRGPWRARQRSVGCISPHAWKLPLVMAVCILVYFLPLSLAVSVEPPSGLRPTPDDSPNNQLVAPPDGNRSTFDVAYLGALMDKWLGWAPLQDKLSIYNKHSRKLLRGWKLLPVALMLIFVVLLLLLLAGNMANSSPRTLCSIVQFLLLTIIRVDGAHHEEWLQLYGSNTTTASDPTGPGGPSDAVVIGIPTILVSLLGIIVTAVLTVWGVCYANKKKKDDPRPSLTPTGSSSTLVGLFSTPSRSISLSTLPESPIELGTLHATTSIPSSAGKSDPHFITYVDHLKTQYTQRIRTGDDKRKHCTSTKFINLAIVRKDNVNKSKVNEFTKATVHGKTDYILKEKKPLKLSEVGQVEDGSLASCVLVQGAPGIGKTTMAHELCRQWVEGKVLKEYSLLILLKLRDKSVQKANNVADLFYHSNPSIPPVVASIVEQDNGNGTAFLLDGYNELPRVMQKNSIFAQLINKDILSKACVIVTSRPSASDNLYMHCRQQRYQHLEVLGFTKEQINSFVEKWFDENVEESCRADERHQFELYLESHPHIHALMYIPLNCTIVLTVYQSKGVRDDHKTLTKLYIHNTEAILTRYLTNHEEVLGNRRWNLRNLRNLRNLPLNVQQHLMQLSKLAYSGIVSTPGPEPQLIFQEEEIPPDLSDNEAMGFMNMEYDALGTASYNFLHLTIQEFLAAYYVSKLPLSEQAQVIDDSVGKVHLVIMLRFYAGLTKFHSQQSSDSSVFTPAGSFRRYYYSKNSSKLESLRWMFETQEKQLLRQTLGTETQDLDLSHQTLAPFDCYVIGYCIAYSECQWRLNLSWFTLGEEGMRMLSRGSNDCFHRVQAIDLSWNDIKAGVTHLASSLRNNTVLTELRLVCCGIDDMRASQLAETLSCIKMLDLSLNIVNLQCARHLASALRENTVLTELRLRGCGIDAEGTSKLAEALLNIKTLSELDLSANTVNSEGARHLVSALRGNTVLTELRLEHCHIDAEGTSHLVQALCDIKTLKELDLRTNTVNSQSARHLARLLYSTRSLTELYLEHCNIGEDGACELARALRANSTLRELSLWDNPFEEGGAIELVESLACNTELNMKLSKQHYGDTIHERIVYLEVKNRVHWH